MSTKRGRDQEAPGDEMSADVHAFDEAIANDDGERITHETLVEELGL